MERCPRLHSVGKKIGPNPTDRAKDGTKRCVLTEADGIPIGLAVDGANRNDYKMVRETIESIPVRRPKPTANQHQGMCMDKGFDYAEVYELLKEFKFTDHIRSRGEEAQKLKRRAGFKARRWVVERTIAWLQRCRALLIRYDKNPTNYLGLIQLACALLWYRRRHRLQHC